MRGVYTVLLLIVSNIFMTFAWYGNLKLQDMGVIKDWPLIFIILASWGVALLEYSAMVPANRIGSEVNGGPFNLVELKVIQEVVIWEETDGKDEGVDLEFLLGSRDWLHSVIDFGKNDFLKPAFTDDFADGMAEIKRDAIVL